jgi:hypothetical protein
MLNINRSSQSSYIFGDIVAEHHRSHRRFPSAALAHKQHLSVLLLPGGIHLCGQCEQVTLVQVDLESGDALQQGGEKLGRATSWTLMSVWEATIFEQKLRLILTPF